MGVIMQRNRYLVYDDLLMRIVRPKWFSIPCQNAGIAVLRTMARSARSVMEVMFPPCCLACGGEVASDAVSLCRDCAQRVERERREPACPRCASSVAPHEVSNGRCAACRRRRLRVVNTIRVGSYAGRDADGDLDGPAISCVGRLLRAYKYAGREEIEPLLGGWLADAVRRASWMTQVEAIASVPTHWKRRFLRPLHAAERLAAVVSRETGVPHVPLLRRVRAGPRQVDLGYADRVRNVRGAFAVRRNIILEQTRLLLIDDVKTTGATLNECAKTLRRAGASEVYAAVLVTAAWSSDRSTARNVI